MALKRYSPEELRASDRLAKEIFDLVVSKRLETKMWARTIKKSGDLLRAFRKKK